jgi:hypothetical protein
MRAAEDVPNITYSSRHESGKGELETKAASTVYSDSSLDFTANGPFGQLRFGALRSG